MRDLGAGERRVCNLFFVYKPQSKFEQETSARDAMRNLKGTHLAGTIDRALARLLSQDVQEKTCGYSV